MRTNKNTSKIILATVVALLATMISYSAFSNMNNQLTQQQKFIEMMQKKKANEYKENYAYAVAKKDLKAGELVSDDDVDFAQFEQINNSAFQNRSDIVNKVLLQDIQTGATFTTAHIAKVSNDDVTLKEGYRALTLPAENFQGKSSKMVIGSNVDIYSASTDNPWDMENVKILSFEGVGGQSSTSADGSAAQAPSGVDMTTATAITFEVAANDIADFISNISKNRLVLVARNPKDKKVSHKRNSSSLGHAYKSSSMSSLPNLPSSVPISNLSESGNMSGLPQPLKPQVDPPSVELIEANVKSKVTFD